jgi:excinuclease UvrABC nuclease subunit
MPLEEMIDKASVYNALDLVDGKFKSIPMNGRGVYALCSLSGKTLYVGKSEKMRDRIRTHLNGKEKITEEYSPFISRIKVFYVDDEVGRQNLYSVEKWFIDQLESVFNVTRFDPHTARRHINKS